MDNCTVAAVVVTYNRKYLLRENLQALQAQTRKPDKIIVVDNASTDGTDSMINVEFSNADVDYLRLPQNVGGAGGFHEGIKYAYERGYEWIWLMDDDTIPEVDALEKLLLAHNRLKSKGVCVRLLGSRVNWIDGSVHPMNMPSYINVKSHDLMILLIENKCLPVRNVSFVSMMMHRDLVSKYGLPVKSYFIWNDDVEYTARITRNESGVIVLDSIVVHKTKSKYVPITTSSPERFYFEVRNKIWMIKKSEAWETREKVKLCINLAFNVIRFLKINSLRGSIHIFRGLWDGILKKP